MNLPHHERIDDPIFRQAVALIDAGDEAALRSLLLQHPNLTHQQVLFPGDNYFRNPTLLEFIAENPIRHGKLPSNITAITKIIIAAGASQSAINETLGLVSTGRITREYGVQIPLIELLCDQGADPNTALLPAAAHGEHEAVEALLKRGATLTLPIAAALNRIHEFNQLYPSSSSEDRHMALAMAAQFGHVQIVKLLLEAGEDPNRFNPSWAHSHSTPLHQAALAGHEDVVHLLVSRGARLDLKDLLWQGTPADWARHAGKKEIESYLRAAPNQLFSDPK